jgi:hypothetical protein
VKTTKSLSQDSRLPGRNLNRRLPDYEAEVVDTLPLRSVLSRLCMLHAQKPAFTSTSHGSPDLLMATTKLCSCNERLLPPVCTGVYRYVPVCTSVYRCYGGNRSRHSGLWRLVTPLLFVMTVISLSWPISAPSLTPCTVTVIIIAIRAAKCRVKSDRSRPIDALWGSELYN